jgi:hypothetical protein
LHTGIQPTYEQQVRGIDGTGFPGRMAGV